MSFDLNPLLSAAISIWVEKKFLDNVSARVPLINWLKERGRIKEWDGAGVYINEPALTTIDISRVQALEEYQEIDLAPETGQRVIPFTPKEVVNSVLIAHREYQACTGEAKMIDLLESKMEQAELEFAEQMESWLFGDGTEEGGKVPLGLAAIIATTNTSGTICGFDRSTATWIRNQSVSGAQTSTAYDNLKVKMENLYNTCQRGNVHTELILFTQTIFEAYKELYGDKFLFQDQATADLGFDNIKFRKAAISFGDYVPSATGFFINSKALKLRSRMNNGSPFKAGPLVNLEDTLKMRARGSLITWDGALTFNMPRTLGVLHSIS